MTSTSQGHVKKISLILIFLMVLLSSTATAQEWGRCEEAYKYCLINSLRFFPDIVYLYSHITVCTIGYIFCKRYLDHSNLS